MVFQDALSAVDAAKQLKKIIWSENNSADFMNVTTAEEHNIDVPELPHYLKLQLGNGEPCSLSKITFLPSSKNSSNVCMTVS